MCTHISECECKCLVRHCVNECKCIHGSASSVCVWRGSVAMTTLLSEIEEGRECPTGR